MIRANAPHHVSPSIVLQRLPEDVSQAVCLITSILSVNEETTIEPGELQGMNRVLEHAKDTLEEMKAGSRPPDDEPGGPTFAPKPIFLE